jgi:hypothetical protein
MTTAENFVNWLEGFLDACNNAPTSKQVKEIRKKIDLHRANDEESYQSLWNPDMPTQSSRAFSTITLVQPPKHEQLSDAFIKAIEENKTASTMEELNS